MSAPTTCFLCEYWKFDPGDQDWSDVTLDYKWSSQCRKGHWKRERDDANEMLLGEILSTIKDCPDFVRYDGAKKR